MKTRATNNCPVLYNFVNILPNVIFSSGLQALELALPLWAMISLFLDHKNDKESVTCIKDPGRYMQSSEKCCCCCYCCEGGSEMIKSADSSQKSHKRGTIISGHPADWYVSDYQFIEI